MAVYELHSEAKHQDAGLDAATAVLRNRIAKTLALLVVTSLSLFTAQYTQANSTYFTYIDNEDNNGTGFPDDDLDTLIGAGSGTHPIEFNIDVTSLPASLTSASLSINAFDIDEEAGEIDQVFFNGTLLGSLAGEDNLDSTTSFDVPTNLVQAGNNLVQIYVPSVGGWALRVAWGQLLLNGGRQGDANITSVELADYSVEGGTVNLDIEINADIASTNNYRMEINLVDPNNNIVNLDAEDFTGIAAQTYNNTFQLSYPVTDVDAIFTLQAQLFSYSAGFPVAEETQETTFEHIINLGPHLPAVPEFSVLSASNFAVIADGSTPTTITLQGVDSSGQNTTYDGQAVTFSSNIGTMGAVSDLGDGTYEAILVAPSVAGEALITATIDGVTVTDTAEISFVPGPPTVENTTISTNDVTIIADGSSSTTVIVQTIDEFGNALTNGGQSVLLTTSRGTLSEVSDLGNGSYAAVLTSSLAVGTANISGLLNGEAILDDASVNFITGPANIATSTITPDLSSIYADGVTQTEVTVRAIDVGGNLLFVGGDTVVINTNLGSMGGVTDNNDGTYTAILTSGTSTGIASITGTINGAQIVDTANVNFAALPTVDTLGTNTATPTLSGTVDVISGASFTVSLNGQTYVPNDGNLLVTAGTWSLTVPGVNALSDGTYSVLARVTDSAAQTSIDTSDDELTIDTTAPTITLNTLSEATGLNILAYNISGVCTDIGDTVTLNLSDTRGNTLSETDILCVDLGAGGVFNQVLDISPLRDGTITVEAVITDIGTNQAIDTTTISKDSCTPDESSPLCDSDGDGVPDGIEEDTGTLPFDADSDGDTIEDDIEYGDDVTNPLDTDNDGTIDALDLDSDNDGIPDQIEVGDTPSAPRDTDGDGTVDFRDLDSDADFVPDSAEYAYVSLDPDSDGLESFIDPDSDNDGLPDALENGVALHLDSDGDGIDDAWDIDSFTDARDINNDGINDAISLLDTDEDGRYNMFDIDSDNDGMPGWLESDLDTSADVDADGINDFFDVDVTTRIDADQDGLDDLRQALDSDGDGVPNYLDIDSDNDTLADVTEAGGIDVAPVDGIIDDQANTQGLNTSPSDSDADGIPNYLDLESTNPLNNLIGPFDIAASANAAALDRNNDGTIDLLTDTDLDGVTDEVDETLFNFGSYLDHDEDGLINALDLDDDNDGIPDTAEGSGLVDTDQDGWADNADLDSDNDSITDLIESGAMLTDEDNNGIIDNFSDQDNNGLDDTASATAIPVDTDNDGTADFRDLESDSDGLFDINEAYSADIDMTLIDLDEDGMADDIIGRGIVAVFATPVDTDGDGIPDYADRDSDNDGINDRLETQDVNNNGVSDHLEAGQGKIQSSVQGAGAPDRLLLSLGLLALIMTYFKRRISKQTSSKHTLLSTLLMSSMLLSALMLESDLAQAESIETESSNTEVVELTSDSASPLRQCGARYSSGFQHCLYGTAQAFASTLEPFGESNGWSIDDKNSAGGSIGIGWLFAPQWSLEAHYYDLGSTTLKNSNPVLDASVDAKVDYRTPAFMLSYALFPHTETYNFHVKLGAARIQAKVNSSTVQFESDTDTQASVGAGLSYRFDDSPWFVSLEYTGLSEDANTFGLQIGRYFWRSAKPAPQAPTHSFQPTPPELDLKVRDTDQDGVMDIDDLCPLSSPGEVVDANGCCTSENGCTVIYPQ